MLFIEGPGMSPRFSAYMYHPIEERNWPASYKLFSPMLVNSSLPQSYFVRCIHSLVRRISQEVIDSRA
jgi:hypothetical protein